MRKNILAKPLFNEGFFALFSVQFLGAFNDNLVKNAVAILISYRLVSEADAGFWLSVAAGLFILPFMLISPWAGRLADHYDKVHLIRLIKLAEIGLALLAAWALISQQLLWLLVTVTALGVQSAFFGPIKYAIIPERVAPSQWMRANAWFSGSTFIAILLGTLLGGLGAVSEASLIVLALGVVLVALAGAGASFLVQPRTQTDSSRLLSPNVGLGYWSSMHQVWQGWGDGRGRLVIAISLFWFIGASLLSQLPQWVQSLGGNEQVAIIWLAGFALCFGIGAGLRASLRWFNWRQQAWWLALMALVLADAAWLSYQAEPQALVAPRVFFSDLSSWRVSIDLAIIALLGGLYSVPLYTQLQKQVPAQARARAFALNNVMNALWMVASALALMLGYSVGLIWPQLAGLLAVMIMLMALWVAWRFGQTAWLVERANDEEQI
ncbi:MFS transporter [Thiomicrospira aerophila AL3]|uniref:MFS transporter n=1 Tax=Thiomicrospira aerophila AL3 TaxID=717772 RepID=W0DXV5_9GAMM|nr:MFS transporter [Thiomicrospira aerophila]AHF02113.1 MFS transporter [Thiomicrospira aerophila AL3]